MTARLCPDTLREAATMVVARDIEGIHRGDGHIGGYGPRVADWLRGWAAETAAVNADAAASETPRLSAWIAACEGTGIGEPTWIVWDDGMRAYYTDGTIVVIDIDEGRCVEASITSEAIVCSTPAELRAALERLAQEAKR